MTETYLKSKQYYQDQYDRLTVEEGRRIESRPYDVESIRKKIEVENIDEKEAVRAIITAQNLYMYFFTGDRYVKKEETIREWMKKDEARDQLLEEATAPEDITCHTCGRLMFVSSKHLNIGIRDDDTVLFFYDCPLEHLPRRAFYNTGEEFVREKPKCPKCNSELVEENKKTKYKLTTTSACPNCNYNNTDVIDFSEKPNEEVEDPDYAKDRERFCLTEKAGQDFIDSYERMKQMGNLVDKWKEKEKNKDIYDAAAKLKKLKIIELLELLTPILERAGYIKLQFKDPEVTRDVFVPFIVYEQKPDREGRASTYELEKLLRKTLKDTNWRMVTGGVNYRLGMLEGRLHGYEREEDLIKLVSKK
jgi:ssDNA-binding Zn-finger/Zn-ribbon topoisomerase 1